MRKRDLAALGELIARKREEEEKASVYGALALRWALDLLFDGVAEGEDAAGAFETVAAGAGIDRAAFAAAAARDGRCPAPAFERRSVSAVSFLPGRFDRALYDAFPGARFREAESFEEVCEAVADGDADGGALPLYDRDGCILQRADRLRRAYGLKKSAVLRLDCGGESALYGLYTKTLFDTPDADAAEASVYGGELIRTVSDLLRALGVGFDLTKTRENAYFTLTGSPDEISAALRALPLLSGELSVDGLYRLPQI
ncbi:MAG: hypothetical protein IJU52_03735 [Clostridia bacterium]|nr:hypothetical protein [Clostridia bacterium]